MQEISAINEIIQIWRNYSQELYNERKEEDQSADEESRTKLDNQIYMLIKTNWEKK